MKFEHITFVGKLQYTTELLESIIDSNEFELVDPNYKENIHKAHLIMSAVTRIEYHKRVKEHGQ